MTTYFNFIILAVTLTVALGITYLILKQKSQNKETVLTKLNGISLLILNAITWGGYILINPVVSFNQIGLNVLIVSSLFAVFIPLLELKFPKFERFFIFIYIFIGFGITALGFDISWQYSLIIAILWGVFTVLLEPFNGEAKIASKSLVIILGGILFLNIFYNTTLPIIFLALILGICLFAFNASAKNEIISLQLSKPALHGFAFLTGLFFVYLASLGYFFAGIIIPIYFITERVVYYIVYGIKKIFKKTLPPTYFFEKAINRGANLGALNQYISRMLYIFIMIAAIYSPEILSLLIIAGLFIVFKMFYDLNRWGERIPSIKETWKNAVADAKKATSEIKNNFSTIKNKINKDNK